MRLIKSSKKIKPKDNRMMKPVLETHLILARSSSRRRLRETMRGWLMASPWIIGFLIFTLIPIIMLFVLSFMEWNLLTPPKFIGLDNYKKMLFQEPQVWKSVWITTYYSIISVPLNLVLGFLLALLLNRNIKGLFFWRSIFYLPTVISGVAVSLLWQWLFSTDFGLFNYITNTVLHIGSINWLGDEHTVIPSLILMNLWTVGASMITNLAGLQNIPTALYEAAKADGAGRIKQTFHITIPMMTPIIFLNLVTGIIQSFQTFTNAYVMTGGGPNKASMFYMLYLYITAFEDFKMGYASALSWMLFLYILILTLIVFVSGRYWVHYEGGDDHR
jgi:multiple sugar transport system permease protein